MLKRFIVGACYTLCEILSAALLSICSGFCFTFFMEFFWPLDPDAGGGDAMGRGAGVVIAMIAAFLLGLHFASLGVEWLNARIRNRGEGQFRSRLEGDGTR